MAEATSIAAVESWVRDKLEAGGSPAHGWLHTDRVRHHIRYLAQAEDVDPVLAEIAALLHDVGRTEPGPEEEHGARSAAMAEPLLHTLPLADGERQAVLHAVRWHNSTRADSPLLCTLRDADMLDGLGAIGIMRGFMSKGHLPRYDPGAPFERDGSGWPAFSASDQILGQMRFYAWLNTETARQMAVERFDFMRAFVAQVQREVPADGKDP
jgi:uncharacterized protein